MGQEWGVGDLAQKGKRRFHPFVEFTLQTSHFLHLSPCFPEVISPVGHYLWIWTVLEMHPLNSEIGLFPSSERNLWPNDQDFRSELIAHTCSWKMSFLQIEIFALPGFLKIGLCTSITPKRRSQYSQFLLFTRKSLALCTPCISVKFQKRLNPARCLFFPFPVLARVSRDIIKIFLKPTTPEKDDIKHHFWKANVALQSIDEVWMWPSRICCGCYVYHKIHNMKMEMPHFSNGVEWLMVAIKQRWKWCKNNFLKWTVSQVLDQKSFPNHF